MALLHDDIINEFTASERFSEVLAEAGWTPFNVGDGRDRCGRDFLCFTRSRKLEKAAESDGGDTQISPMKTGNKTAFCSWSDIEKMAQPCGFAGHTQISLWVKGIEIKSVVSEGVVVPVSVGAGAVSAVTGGEEEKLVLSGGIETLNGMGSSASSVCIGVSCEWTGMNPRRVLTWCLSTVSGDELVELAFFPRDPEVLLPASYAVGRMLDRIGLYNPKSNENMYRYRYYVVDHAASVPKGGLVPKMVVTKHLSEAIEKAEIAIIDGKPSRFMLKDAEKWRGKLPKSAKVAEYELFKDTKAIAERLSVTLVCHSGDMVLSTFAKDPDGSRVSLYGGLVSAHGGSFTTVPLDLLAPSFLKKKRAGYSYRLSLSIRDTMCFTGGDDKSLSALGKAAGIPKILVDSEMKANMDQYLLIDPISYMDYVSRDSVIPLAYSAAMFGANTEMPCTITGAAASAARDYCMQYLGCDTEEEFNQTYRGIRKEDLSLTVVEKEEKPAFIRNSRAVCLNDKARRLQLMASSAFRGGCNASSKIGYFNTTTFDVDMKNAYPTAMCLIPDVDWEDAIRSEIHNQELRLSDFLAVGNQFNPIQMLFCYCRFEFPENVAFPCIPYPVEQVLVFPRTSKCSRDENGYVYACGPEIFLALKLGAKVFVETGYYVRSLMNDNGESRSIAFAMKHFVQDRGLAELLYGKGSLQEQTLKIMNNAVYGKVAQAVADKEARKYMDGQALPPSAITNPVTAAMTTSIVRATLLAAMNQVKNAGYNVYSVTTDGFITDMPPKELSTLDLYGFRSALNASRQFLTGEQEGGIWSVKHVQDDLLNFCTRGNVSLRGKLAGNPMEYEGELYDGVIARNGAKSPFGKKTLEDRKWLVERVLSRRGKVHCEETVRTPFKDLAGGKDFIVKRQGKSLSMDFDMKRKPVKESFYTEHPSVSGIEYEISCFDTVPFEDMDEFLDYRKKAGNVKCLRTETDWAFFWDSFERGEEETVEEAIPAVAGEALLSAPKKRRGGAKIRDLDWAVLNSCIMGYRAGMWDIPHLNDPKLTKAEKCEWIQKFNKSPHVFKPGDWDHASEKNRQKNMLPKKLLAGLLKKMQEEK